ncbi:MAG TPA: C25 family cysteine peptidase [Polyangia bacterium]|nr:C25 family cysteine peptidase [Polyangia bacterium]
MAGGRKAQATPNVGITSETLNQTFGTAVASGSYAHTVKSGSNLALVVTVGITNSTVSISSVQWDPDTTVSGNEQTLSCPAANLVTMGTNRKLAICTLLAPTASSGNGQVTVTFSGGTDTFTSSATTFTGISGFRTATNSGGAKTFGTWTACTLVGTSATYTCSLSATTSTDDVVFDLAGQGEPGDNTTRTYTAGTGQTKHEDAASVTNTNNNRVATSIKIATGSTTTMSWTYGNAGSGNGVGQIALPMIPASTVTAARMGARGAVRYGAAGTRIAWQTEEEASHLGFQVWRERRGVRTRVGRGLIPGSTFATGAQPLAGRRGYEAWDDQGQPGDRYWLEEVAAHGPARWHGPVTPSPGGESAGRRLRRQSTPSAATFAAPAESPPEAPVVPRAPLPELTPASACANPPAWGPAVKIAVSTTGWTHVDAAALVAAGLPADADPASLALWVDGQPAGLRAIGAPRLEAIEFYGQGADTHDTGTRIYWLVAGNGRGRAIPFAPSAASDSAPLVADSSIAEVTLRERSLYVAALRNGRADNFFGAVLSTAPVNEVVAVPDPLPGRPASLVVALQGMNADANQVAVTLNGAPLGTVSWSGVAPVAQELAIPADLLADGPNTVVLTPGAGGGLAVLDRLTVRYARPYRAVGDRLEATAPAGAHLSLTGFSRPDARAFDVTDPRAPIELAGVPFPDSDGYGLAVQLPAGGAPGAVRIVRAQSSAGLAAPDAVTANVPSGICAAVGAEVAVVAPRAFFPALAPWVAARQAAGWSIELVDVEDVFDEMTFGAHRSDAITDFVRVRRDAGGRTRYLLLAGSASLDPRNFLGKNVADLVPTALIDTDVIETASDEALADLDGDGVAEVAVGRWPARTADELGTMVAATLSLQQASPFDATPLVVTGTDGDPQFLRFEQAVASVLPTAPDDFDPNGLSADAARSGLMARWSAGPGFIQYFGHGSEQIWQGLLSADDVDQLPQTGRRPVISAMTCLNGMFQDVYQDCLASRLMRAPSGAAAVWASSDLYDAGAQGALAAAFAANASRMALGAAVHAARVATGGAGRAMVLFGDPTLFGSPSPPPARPDAGASSVDAAATAAEAGTTVVDNGLPVTGSGPSPPPSSEAGATPGSPAQGGGGGCAIAGTPASPAAFLLAAVALAAARRRRRRFSAGRR